MIKRWDRAKLPPEVIESIITVFEDSLEKNCILVSGDFDDEDSASDGFDIINGIPSSVLKDFADENNIHLQTLLGYLRSCNYFLRGTKKINIFYLFPNLSRSVLSLLK